MVDAAMDSLRLRPTAALSADQMHALRQALGARYLIVGALLEQNTIRTPDATYPCAGLTLRLLDADSARVVWADSKFHCGDDDERIFGWGRDFDPAHVAARLTDELTREVRQAVWPELEKGH